MSKRSFPKNNRKTSSNRRAAPAKTGAPVKERPQQEHNRVVGVLEKTPSGFTITSADRRDQNTYKILPAGAQKSQVGNLVVAEITTRNAESGNCAARVLKRIGDPDDPRNLSMIAIEQHEIPYEFSAAAIKEAEDAKPVTMKGRVDLRPIPLVTIDGEDARDFDDAVFAEPKQDGWHVIVAIADVSHYVRPGSELDKTAYERGNSTYFPDRVVPMLPEALSNELCSLKPNVDRACMAVHLYIDESGELKKWEFVRGVMKSVARLTYEQVEEAHQGRADTTTKKLLPQIDALYGVYKALKNARNKRGTLDLDIPERKVILKKDGTVDYVKFREHLTSHQLIEELMIAANVAAATELNGRGCIYRVHDKPSELKLFSLREQLEEMKIPLVPSKDLHPKFLKEILAKVSGKPEAPTVSEAILRSMAKAVYSPENIGHFGLALSQYAHFTSPIRRYADLIVHRGLIRAKKFGDDGLTDHEMGALESISEHISGTEQRSATAERDVVDRFTTLFLADHVGDVFEGRISGVHGRMGLFVRLNDTGAEGIVRLQDLPKDYYRFHEGAQKFVGERTKQEFRMMDPIKVRLDEVDKLTSSLRFSVCDESDPKKAPKQAVSSKRKEKPRRSRKG